MTKFYRVVKAVGMTDLVGCAFTERQIARALARGVLKPGMRFSWGTNQFVLKREGGLVPYDRDAAAPSLGGPLLSRPVNAPRSAAHIAASAGVDRKFP